MLRSRDGNTFAAVYEVVPGEPWRVSMESFTDTGAMVRTVMPGAGLEQASRWCSRWEVGQCGLDELLHHHAGHVNQFVATHGGVVARVSLADRAAIDERL
ncbi:MAG TPA: hypothetical protein VKE74_16365, partial [Gemmataceae bacterium]|nr:hypothetical protein [Gemmataceae bacterium]